ncbi:BTAD domain-containing putative transcriptional regulator [Streptomyces fuscichromogenes]|uniref:BTAD domain-containing putative transcriptional regulator n=1 Tax=Streptomyces fuscichromogenes TaxID=1324013 RepID=UPI001E394059|nr:BTAD domain-containing putative transcriptional regulator [Streptomyces fuscichromogenes]
MRYRILGTAQATDEQGAPIPVGGPRLRALLTVLALHPARTLTPEILIQEIWAADDDPPQDAPAALQALVGRLRRSLGKDSITSGPGGYRLAATADDVDLHVFERQVREGGQALAAGDPAAAHRLLTEALALWRGPALADLPDRVAAAVRPAALRLEATRARADAALRLGRAADALPELTGLTTDHPYDESLHALLIRALCDTGRPADALAAYETARRTLADGLGAVPGPELQALHASLLTPEPDPLGAPPPRTGNLRPRLTSFVGREPELEAVRSELHRARLVTLTGPGGSGKTRLAEEAAAGLPQAWLVELAPLDRPEAVPGAVVSALGLRETVLMTNELATVQTDPTALLVEYCAPRSQLLILDNCEHVIEAAAALAETLLTHCPGLTVLATSREPLGVPGESVRPVEPLAPEHAHRLFEERAATVRPGTGTGTGTGAAPGDAAAVDEICRRLDGLPLAIELAAARLRLLTPRQIADRLDDRFRLLTAGSRTVLPRQQTLRAVVDWSWDLLDERERTMLREVSVFAGGWDLTAAEAVCTGPAADLVGALVDKSLIVATPDGTGGMRYRMLETIHEYAVERAAELPGLRAAAERRHGTWVRALVEEAEPRLRSGEQLPWIRRLETDLDNIRAALDRAMRAGDEVQAGRIVLAVGWFWWLRNYRQEATASFRAVLRLGVARDALPEDAGPDELRALADAADPVGAFLAAPDAGAGHPLCELRMDLRLYDLFLAAESGQPDLVADERTPRYLSLIRAAFEPGGPRAARLPGLIWPLTAWTLGGPAVDIAPDMSAVVDNCREYGGDWEVGVSLMYRTHIMVDSPGNLRGVDEDLAELRVLGRRVGDRWMRAQVCSAAGEADMARGRFAAAEGEYREALRLAHEVGAYAETPFLLARLAEIAFRSGDRAGARIALDRAGEASDRYGVAESKAYVALLRAILAHYDGDLPRARECYEYARDATAAGSAPPQFGAAIRVVEAMLTAQEHGPARALPIVAEGLREAVEYRCAEVITAALVDVGADLLARLGDLAGAVRLYAAADHWRAGSVRPEPERTRAAEVDETARTTLTARRYAAERSRGASLTEEDALRELNSTPAATGI